jgi:pimeloyl-ACP methyl ester carboxylesterase
MAVMLAHELLTGPTPPERWMLFLHGILGRRINWRSFARSWVERRPGWGAVLVDLRDHGDSQDLPGPRTVEAAADDLLPLADAIVREHAAPIAGVLGHSFGGKVAILGAAALRGGGHAVEELWVIDAPPGPRTQPRDLTTEHVFAALRSLPARHDSRTAFVDALVAERISKPTAQWLATNLIEVHDGWSFPLDLDRIGALLQDFKRIDTWPILLGEAEAGTRATLVLGERSQAVFGDELERARTLAQAGPLSLACVAKAGHWVHVDNPTGLLDVLAPAAHA